MTREGQQSEYNEPECVARADAEAEGAGEVEPETLPELAGDGCDGHCCCCAVVCLRTAEEVVGSGGGRCECGE